MNTKNNQRTRLSRLLMKNAMLDLLEEKKAAEKISVRALCERAQLNRSTFYAHYTEPKDLLHEIEDDLLSSAQRYLEQIGKADHVSAAAYVLSFLQYIRKNDKEYRILLVDTVDSDFKNRFLLSAAGQLIRSFDIELRPEQEQFVYSYILNGSSAVIIQWIRSGYAVDESKLVELLFRMNQHLLEGVE